MVFRKIRERVSKATAERRADYASKQIALREARGVKRKAYAEELKKVAREKGIEKARGRTRTSFSSILANRIAPTPQKKRTYTRTYKRPTKRTYTRTYKRPTKRTYTRTYKRPAKKTYTRTYKKPQQQEYQPLDIGGFI